MTDNKCRGKIWNGYHFYRCGKNAKYQRDGKWYCGTHDPVRIVEKRKARDAKWDAKREAERTEAASDLQAARAAAFLQLMAWRDTDGNLHLMSEFLKVFTLLLDEPSQESK